MNKLDVALKLLILLNERKSIDSTLVADKLDVSLRTAQRYVNELSRLPCVICDEKTHKFSIIPDYHLKLAIGENVLPAALSSQYDKFLKDTLSLMDITCKVCGNECVIQKQPVGK